MKHQPWQSCMLALSVTLSVAGCGKEQKPVAAPTNVPASSVDKLKEQARNAVTTTKDYLAQQKDRWQKRYSDKLSEFDHKLADLKAKSSQASDKAKSEWDKALSQLELKKASAAQKLEQFIHLCEPWLLSWLRQSSSNTKSADTRCDFSTSPRPDYSS